MKTRRFVSKWMPVIAWMLLMFAGSTDVLSAEHTSRFLIPFLRWLDPTISFQTIAVIHFTLRKIGHFTEYAILAALLWRALRGTFTWLKIGAITISTFLIAAAFAASDEFHQSFVPTRTASARDVMIDCIGALVAVLLCWIFTRERVVERVGEV
jgi:VanZ family protein